MSGALSRKENRFSAQRADPLERMVPLKRVEKIYLRAPLKMVI